MQSKGPVCGNGCDYAVMGNSYSLNSSSDVRLVSPGWGGWGLPVSQMGYGGGNQCATNGHFLVGDAYPCFNARRNQCNKAQNCGYGGSSPCNCG